MKTTIVGFGDSLTYGYGVASKYTHMKRLQDALPLIYLQKKKQIYMNCIYL